jgi:hypothetical protein
MLQMPSFQESRSSRDNPKHDWYFWKDPRYNEQGNRIPPNNWESNFGGTYTHIFIRGNCTEILQVLRGHGRKAVDNIVSFRYFSMEYESS